MYRNEKAVLFTRVSDCGQVIESVLTHLPTNGAYIRGLTGQVLGRYGYEDRGIFYSGECEGVSFHGNIKDLVLCDRINDYFANISGKRYTNCAAMAHFLTTGKFVECVEDGGMAVVHQGMRPYEMAKKVDIGDMVCIIYGSPRIIGSRSSEFRTEFRKAQKRGWDQGTFASSVPMRLRSFTAEEVRMLCQCLSVADFHFMVCVDHCRGNPVWISQCGYSKQGEDSGLVALTIGEYSPYQREVPLFSLIKKKR
jgi:hypothetical protein